MADFSNVKKPKEATAVIVMADGTVIWGQGIGAKRRSVGEICFNTGMTGYQETLSDPSYAGQIITFTTPHIGNVGTNDDDTETEKPAVHGLILRQPVTAPSNWRATEHLDIWLTAHNLPGIWGVDTRALTRRIREEGAPNGILCHNPDGFFDLNKLHTEAATWPGLKGMDLAGQVTCEKAYEWNGAGTHHVVAVDFGAKRNILRCLANAGCRVSVVPAATPANDIMALKPDGIFLSNGPGDPQATGLYAVKTVKKLLKTGMPIFGICLGHQILTLALGGQTQKMHLGHRGANHPVKDIETGKVEITSQNHGFEVVGESLPKNLETTHISLFDGSNEGIKLKGKPVFSVQYHPEASPGPQDSHYLFDRFVENICSHKGHYA